MIEQVGCFAYASGVLRQSNCKQLKPGLERNRNIVPNVQLHFPSRSMSSGGELSLLKTDSFAHLADVSSHPGSRLFSSSWCPTMDLFALATPLSNRQRLTLWKMGGHKLWDVEVGRGEAPSESIEDVVWSPSGQSNEQKAVLSIVGKHD